MKISKFLLFFLVAVSLSSCFKKLKDSVTPEGTAKIVFDGKSVTLNTPTAVTLLGVVTIEGKKDKSSFTILLNKADIKTGKSYDLKSSTGFFTFIYEGTVYLANSGTLDITNFKDNSIVEGKFNFEGTPVGKTTKTTISGEFSAKIVI